jgi:hypothetical protein
MYNQQPKYRSKLARTRSFTLSVRSTVLGPQERVLFVDRPRKTNEKQARKGVVYPFVPDVSYICCKKRCARHFRSTDPILELARAPLFDHLMDRDVLREKLKSNWNIHLKLPDNTRCCKTMMLRIYGVSSSFIYGDKLGKRKSSQGDGNSQKNKVATSIASWFFLLRETADCMPDGEWYQLNIPMRTMVFANYNADAAESDGRLVHCNSQAYFCKVWHDNFPEIKLRKHCRFAKCDFCVHWRQAGRDWNMKAEATERCVRCCLFCSVTFCCFISLFSWIA